MPDDAGWRRTDLSLSGAAHAESMSERNFRPTFGHFQIPIQLMSRIEIFVSCYAVPYTSVMTDTRSDS